MFYSFVTKRACDGQIDKRTDGQNYDPKTALAYLLRAVKVTQVIQVNVINMYQKP